VIPKDWEVNYIGNLADISTGSRNTQDRVEDGEYPFFVRSQTVERINSYSYDGEAVLTAGDGVGTGKVFHYINGKFDVHQRVYRITDFVPSLDGYFFYLFFASNFYDRIMQMTAKSSVDSVRMDMIAKMQFPYLPSLNSKPSRQRWAMRMPTSTRWRSASPSSGWSSKARCRSCSRASGGCRGLRGSGGEAAGGIGEYS
jgi:type I restriction enzyme S subunit